MKTNTRDTVLYDTRKNNETINNTNIKTLYDVAADCISEKGIIASDDEITNVLNQEINKSDIRTIESKNDKTLAFCNKYVNITGENINSQKSRDDQVKELYIKLQANNNTEDALDIHNKMYEKISKEKDKLWTATMDALRLEDECYIWLKQKLENIKQEEKYIRKQ